MTLRRKLTWVTMAVVISVLIMTIVPSRMATALPVGPKAVLNVRPADGDLDKIKHLVFIVQENRSFDHYFGAYPGADGISFDANGVPTKCMPTGVDAPTCIRPYHESKDIQAGGPHDVVAHLDGVDGGAMDGFLEALTRRNTQPLCPPGYHPCKLVQRDPVSFHDAREIPNYWSYADNFVLQDEMFESVRSWSAPAHVSLVSGWSATCEAEDDPYTCQSDLSRYQWPDTPIYAHTDITQLLHNAGVSWGYYTSGGPGSLEPDCEDPSETPCVQAGLDPKGPSIWNPLPDFTDVKADGELGNVRPTSDFLGQASTGALPAVSWVIPSSATSEHPPSGVRAGQSYVTNLVNTVMSGPDWDSTAIFVTWDDWGGFADHAVPPASDEDGYGIRVPGLMISPYSKPGFIDHRSLSFDSYLRLIEDRFLGGQRIDPASDGRPDPRPDVREMSPLTGDLRDEFDFSQAPRNPLVLPTAPLPGAPYSSYQRSVSDPSAAAASVHTDQTIVPVNGDAPFDVILSGAGSVAGAAAITSWQMTFGDGTSASGDGAPANDVAHQYTDAGNYTAQLTVTDSAGLSDATTVDVRVGDPPAHAWIDGPTVGTAPFDATFNLSHSDSGQWAVHFDDGTSDVTGAGVPPSSLTHRYASVGYHTTTLTVTRADHSKATATNTVRVNPPELPFALTESTGLVGPDYAYLRASIGPGNLPTTFHYEYGATTDYGARTAEENLDDPRYDTRARFTALSGLSALTTYHYRVVVTNTAGTSYGNDETFTTTGASVVSSRASSGFTPSRTTMSAKVDPQNSPMSYHFEWGTTASYGSTSPDAAGGFQPRKVTWTATDLKPNTLYHWRVVVTNSAGTVTSADSTFITAGAPDAVTLKPTVASAGATFKGRVDANHADTTYWFEYGPTLALGSSTSATGAGHGVDPISVSASVSGLAPGTAYYVRLVAQNAYGTSQGTTLRFFT